VFGVGDYLAKNGHLYFITSHAPGGFVVENCRTLFSMFVDFEFLDDEARWIATDKNYRRKRKEVKC
jgi:hypothetical protein